MNLHRRRMLDAYGMREVRGRTALCRLTPDVRCSMMDCVCRVAGNAITVFDHARIWKDEKGNRVISYEPYHIYNAKRARDVLTVQLGPGYRVQLHDYSPYSPGKTHLVTVRRAS